MTRAFTLVELLVVITIIVVLLALLTPAMDQAVYQAELAVCASRQDAIASGLTTYAMAANRAYPYRPVLAEGVTLRRPELIAAEEGADDRPNLRRALGNDLNKVLLDPLTPKVDLDHNFSPIVDTYSNYGLWSGMQWTTVRGGKGLRRLGDRWEWNDDSRGNTSGKFGFTTLVSDFDLSYQRYDGSAVVWTSHSDRDAAVLAPLRIQSRSVLPAGTNGVRRIGGVYSGWWSTTNHRRGPIDSNFAFTDGSVERFGDVEWDDEDMARTPYIQGNWEPAIIWRHVPRR